MKKVSQVRSLFLLDKDEWLSDLMAENERFISIFHIHVIIYLYKEEV